MPSKIRVLDEHTINKIAAGEVIENPASVIKELVENALDAGATDVCVEIKGGGRQLIRVTDNGCGMGEDDALLCLERHATSKIRAVEDIHELMTMGFRGEAVPSIAAISKFSILTRPHDKGSSEGTMVLVDGGSIVKSCRAACSPGTTIEVKSLFFNVPVRKKFQKSPAHDVNEILKMMTLLALGYPAIKFRLISDQEAILCAPQPTAPSFSEQLKERIGAVLGGDYIEECLPLEAEQEEYRLSGWIGSPLNHRQNRTGQYLFINQRGIQSPLVSFAVKDGYGTTLPSQRHPIYVLHLTMPGHLVDVNVHPQKREVRLRQEAALREMVVDAVRKSLGAGTHAHIPLTLPAAPMPLPPVRPTFTAAPPPAAEYRPVVRAATTPPPAPLREDVQLPIALPKPLKNVPKVIAAIPGYLILEGAPDDAPVGHAGLCLVDQRGSHARIIYEQLQRHRRQGGVEVQTLLVPHTIELPPAEAHALKQHLQHLETLGIHLKEFGRSAFLLDGLPAAMGNIDPAAFIKEVVAHLADAREGASMDEQMDRRIAQAAVRSSISKERRLSVSEGQTLVRQLLDCDTPWYCPQGKPTVATVPPEEIHKLFA